MERVLQFTMQNVQLFLSLGCKVTNKYMFATSKEEMGNRIWVSEQFFNLVQGILWNLYIGEEKRCIRHTTYSSYYSGQICMKTVDQKRYKSA